MTDIEVLRQAVIDAARAWVTAGPHAAIRAVNAIEAAVLELDAAMLPDPWQLLAEARDSLPMYGETCRITQRVDAALAWRREHPDE